MWIGSDSWGAKAHPVKEQEFAAEGAITILPFKNSLEGNKTFPITLFFLKNTSSIFNFRHCEMKKNFHLH